MEFNKRSTRKNQEMLLKFSNKWMNQTKDSNNNFIEYREQKPQYNFLVKTWIEFAKNSSIHTVHYLTSETVNAIGKIFWFCVIVIGLVAMVYCCILLSARFRSNLTATVFETTNYPITEIPFPLIGLCNNNHINYNKTEEAVAKFVGNATQKQKEFFVKFTHILQNMMYGSNDEFEPVLDEGYDGFMDNIRISDIILFMMHDCKEFLIECTWREKAVNCCDIFSLQVTEYGYCFSFNSYSNVGTKFVNRSNLFPWRIANQGKKSALTVLMALHLETKVERNTGIDKPGIIPFVQHPQSHPNNGLFVAVNTNAALIIKPTVFSTSDDVSRLHPADRQCYYSVSLVKSSIKLCN